MLYFGLVLVPVPVSFVPTADTEPEPASMPEPMPEHNIAPEPNTMSDQMCEPVTSSVPVGVLMEFEGMD